MMDAKEKEKCQHCAHLGAVGNYGIGFIRCTVCDGKGYLEAWQTQKPLAPAMTGPMFSGPSDWSY
jgi:ribosomal protein L37AE/L43A